MLIWTPGIGELVVIFMIILLFTGAKKLPNLARSIGSGISEFKKGLSGQIDAGEIDEDEPPAKNISKKSSTSGSKKRTQK